jgi:DNA-binding CsgD family transcriptional regulator
MQRAIEKLRATGNSDPEEVRRLAASTLCRFAEADGAAWYLPGYVEGHVRPVAWELVGTESMRSRMRDALQRYQIQAVPWGTGDPRRPPPRWSGSFLTGTALQGQGAPEHAMRFERTVLEPAGLRDKVRLVVYHEGRLVGWIGALRGTDEPAFEPRVTRYLAPLVDPISDALIAADRKEQLQLHEGKAEIIARPDGTVEYVADRALSWVGCEALQQEIATLVRRLEKGRPAGAVVGGMQVDWRRLEGDEGSVRYLLQLERPEPVRLAPDAVLTPAQRSVAQVAARGATAREIASELSMAVESVRSLLREAYRRLDVSSRAELAMVLSEEHEPRAPGMAASPSVSDGEIAQP